MKFIIKDILIICLFCCASSLNAQHAFPYKNPLLPTEERVNDLLNRMTLQEKIAQISHLQSWDVFDGQKLNTAKLAKMCGDKGYGFFEGFPLTAAQCRKNFRIIQTYLLEQTRLGIPGFSVAESLHGVVHEGSTIYPQNIAIGSTFNPALAYEMTKHIAGELNTIGVKQVLAPCIDVARELRWGRVEESFSEDPFLCARMAVAEVKGYMDHGISPMAKHYGPHGNPLGGLNLASVECGIRDLFDVYLKPFEAILAETDILAVMSSYNAWNREPNSASKFMLTDILRDRFGFRGYVYSDWGVIDMLKNFHKTADNDFEAASQALTAGLDVEASSLCFKSLESKVLAGEFDVRYIDRAVKRVLRAKFELGLFEDPYLEKNSYRWPLRSKECISLSRQIADESTVLLKNEGNLLPLDIKKLRSVAVIGPNADCVQFGDYTWSKNKEDGITPLQGICRLAGKKVKVNYAQGCSISSLNQSGIEEAVRAAQQSDVALLFVGSSSTAFVRHSNAPSTSGEGIDLSGVELTGAQEELIEAVCATGKPVVLILVAGKPFAIPFAKKNVPAILVQWYAGEQAGNSIADILFGKVNPSGKISFSFPQSSGHLPAFYNHLTTDKGFYKEPGTYELPGRDYVFSSPNPLWAFGHGLSYTTFDLVSAIADKTHYQAHDTIAVKVKIANSGEVVGKEVVQLYIRDVVSTVMTPIKQLKTFEKVSLNPAETKEITLKVPIHELYLTDNIGNRYLEPGTFEIKVGTASDRIAHRISIEVGSELEKTPVVDSPQIIKVTPSGEFITVQGFVRDAQATPVAYVTVRAISSGQETQTDEKGFYSINLRTDDSIAFVKARFITQQMEVKGRKNINIRLVK